MASSDKQLDSGKRVVTSFSTTLELIDQLRASTRAKQGRENDLLLWRCTAEAEYLAFLIATIHDLNDFTPDTNARMNPSADYAYDLVKRAKELAESNPRLAYGYVRQAVFVLRSLETSVRRAQKLKGQ